MAEKEVLLMKGNEALARAAIESGCRFFFGNRNLNGIGIAYHRFCNKFQ